MEYGKRPLWQWVLIYLIIGGIVYRLAYYSYFAKSKVYDKSGTYKYSYTPVTSQAPEVSENVTENTVVYSDSGFSPKSLNVKLGTTITFKNESSKSMWVASNPHPIHTDYSDFDAKRGYKKGESYQFTFTEAKEYSYHDHLNSGNEGTIKVE